MVSSTSDFIKECEKQLAGFKRPREPEPEPEPESESDGAAAPEPERKRSKIKNVSFAEPVAIQESMQAPIDRQPQFIAVSMTDYTNLVNSHDYFQTLCVTLHKDLAFMNNLNLTLTTKFSKIATELNDIHAIINSKALEISRINRGLMHINTLAQVPQRR